VIVLGVDINGDGKVDNDYFSCTNLFRKLKKIYLSVNNKDSKDCYYCLGPWTIKKLNAVNPMYFDKIFYDSMIDKKVGGLVTSYKKVPTCTKIRVPWVIVGQNAEELANIEYDPTDEEVLKDVKIVKEAITSIIV
jgi:hypothetical protein